MAQRDVVLRWIEQIAKVVRRLIYGPGAQDLDLAAEHVDSAIAQHLGGLSSLLPRVDVPTGANLLNDPERIFGYAQLLGLQGAVQFAKHDPQALATHDRALLFARVAAERVPEVPDSWRAWILEAEAWREGQDSPGSGGAS